MNKKEIPKFDDNEWDFITVKAREEFLFKLFKDQFLFNKNNVEIYQELYSNLEESDINSLNDCVEKIPKVDKKFLRNLPSPFDLVPKDIKEDPTKLYLHRGTGGTTGNPTSIFYTKKDWEAMLGAMSRSVSELKDLKKPLIVFNGYNQGHISGPIFDDTIRKLGGLPISRNFGSSDEQALQQIIDHKCNLIIAPPISTHKGGSMEDLLEVDSRTGKNYINGENIDAVFCSSTELTPEIYKELKDLGIKYIYNYYGSTEILPTAISCQHNPFELHLLQGHIYVAVVDKDQKPVKNGERGLIIASRIGSYNSSGKTAPNGSVELLNYVVGDEVTFIDEPCKCGRTTPRIKKIERVLNTQEKFEGGCEVW